MIPPIFPSTALRADMRVVKDATKDTLAIITGGSKGNYLFGSEKSLEDEISSAAWEEANAERIIESVERGRAGIARGQFVEGTDAAIALSEKIRLERSIAAHG